MLDHHCDKCVTFTYNNNPRLSKLANLKLWLYKEPLLDINHGNKQHQAELKIELLHNNPLRSSSIILKSQLPTRRSGWVGIRIKNKKVWMPHEILDFKLKFHCTNCKVSLDDGKQPFIELKEKRRKRPQRVRREANKCLENSECCTEDFIVDFKKLQWNNWILAPKAFNARQCVGRCDATSHKTLSSYASMIQAVTNKNKRNNKFKLCCTTRKSRDLEILYKDDSGRIVQKTLEGMITASCGCG